MFDEEEEQLRFNRILCLSQYDYAKRQHKRVCSGCGYKLLIDYHHIDFNKKNNKVNNIVPLCCNCHMLIHRLGWSLKDVLSQIKPK